MKKPNSILTGAILASGILFFAGNAHADTIHTVAKGDTLYSIGTKYGVSYKDIMTWNKLTSTTISVNQKIIVQKTAVAAPQPVAPAPTPTPIVTQPKTYTVVSGDTLSSISKKVGIPYQTIMTWNNLTTTTIKVGQVLKLTEPVPEVYDVEKLIALGRTFLGKPYVFGGTTPEKGFDCSGFIYYLYKQQNPDFKRLRVVDYVSIAKPVTEPVRGDLVFFEDTYIEGPSHMGIYLGNGEFLHASSSQGITVSKLSNTYYKEHFLSYGRFIR